MSQLPLCILYTLHLLRAWGLGDIIYHTCVHCSKPFTRQCIRLEQDEVLAADTDCDKGTEDVGSLWQVCVAILK